MRTPIALGFAASCAVAPCAPAHAQEGEEAVRAMQRAAAEEVMACEIDRYAAYWTPDATLFISSGDPLMPVSEYLAIWRGACTGGGGIEFSEPQDEVWIEGTTALATGTVRYSFTDPAGGTHSGTTRTTAVLSRVRESWKFRHVHGSELGLHVPAESGPGGSTSAREDAGRLPAVSIIQMPFTGARNVPEISDNPEYLYRHGIADTILDMGFELVPARTVALTEEEDGEYGSWHRMGLANGHLAEMVAGNLRSGMLTVGLLGNCTSVIGVLGGLQHSGTQGDLREVGLVFIDAHGDFNVPETTLSGMLGGMPVAVSAGMALHNLRRESGLDPGIPTAHIVMGAVRDLDPLERELVEESDIQHLTTEDLARHPDRVRAQIARLADLTDVIYVHIDMDVLDPREVPGHPLTVPDGPTSAELAGALEVMFEHPKVAAVGIASTPANERDPDGLSLKAAYTLIEGALRGVRRRPPEGGDR